MIVLEMPGDNMFSKSRLLSLALKGKCLKCLYLFKAISLSLSQCEHELNGHDP